MKHGTLPPAPIVGQTVQHPHAGLCTIYKVQCYGSILVRDAKGNCYVMSGLGWTVDV